MKKTRSFNHSNPNNRTSWRLQAFLPLLLFVTLSSTTMCTSAPAPPTTVSIRTLSGPWGGYLYTIAHATLIVVRIQPIGENSADAEVFRTKLSADVDFKRLTSLNPATYQGLPDEQLDGGAVLFVELRRGDIKQEVSYQHGTYSVADATTAFLLTYINKHVPAKLALDPSWLKNKEVFRSRK